MVIADAVYDEANYIYLDVLVHEHRELVHSATEKLVLHGE